MILPVDAGVRGVVDDADDLKRAVLAGSGISEAMPDGIAVTEELLDEFLADHRDRWSGERIQRGERSPHDNMSSDRIEVFGYDVVIDRGKVGNERRKLPRSSAKPSDTRRSLWKRRFRGNAGAWWSAREKEPCQ